jgi:hypothetical protein
MRVTGSTYSFKRWTTAARGYRPENTCTNSKAVGGRKGVGHLARKTSSGVRDGYRRLPDVVCTSTSVRVDGHSAAWVLQTDAS